MPMTALSSSKPAAALTDTDASLPLEEPTAPRKSTSPLSPLMMTRSRPAPVTAPLKVRSPPLVSKVVAPEAPIATAPP